MSFPLTWGTRYINIVILLFNWEELTGINLLAASESLSSLLIITLLLYGVSSLERCSLMFEVWNWLILCYSIGVGSLGIFLDL